MHPQPPLLAMGTAAPAIVLQTTDGATDDVLHSASARPIAVEFIETGCVTCQQEAPSLCALQAMLPEALVVAVDAGRAGASQVAAYGQRYQEAACAVTLLVDPKAAVSQSYEITVVPTVYVIDKNGKIAFAGVGKAGIDGVGQVLRRLVGG